MATSPITKDDFEALSSSSDACEAFKGMLRVPGSLNLFLAWLLDDSGAISEEAAATAADYLTPIGTIVLWGGSNLPTDNWRVCNGQAVSRTTYDTLFNRYGTTWGVGDGSTTFNLPNFQGFFPRGVDGPAPLASSGGAETVSLTSANIPDMVSGHYHGVGRRAGGASIDDGNNDYQWIMRNWTKTGTYHYNDHQGDGSLSGNGDFTDSGNVATTTAISDPTASPTAGSAFDNKPPFKSVYFIIKVK